MSHRAFVVAAAGVLLLAGAVAAAPDRASLAMALAGPDLIVFHGGAIERSVRMKDKRENMLFMHGLPQLDTATMGELNRGLAARGVLTVDTAGRPSVDVALFWHPVASKLTARGLPMEQWPIGEAEQHARFFPATARDSALWVWSVNVPGGRAAARRINAVSLAILERHGVQVRTE